MQNDDTGFVLIVLFFVFFAYMFPTVIAISRRHTDAGLIVLSNLLFGWTVLGWCLVFLWATLGSRRP